MGAPLSIKLATWARPYQSSKQHGCALINQVSNMGAPLLVSKAKFYHLHTSTGLSPSTSHSLGLPPPTCTNSWSSLPPHTKEAQIHTPPPTWGMVALVCGLWPHCGHLETTQAVTLKSGSSMTLLQFLNLLALEKTTSESSAVSA